jgi:hypothetical protein
LAHSDTLVLDIASSLYICLNLSEMSMALSSSFKKLHDDSLFYKFVIHLQNVVAVQMLL